MSSVLPAGEALTVPGTDTLDALFRPRCVALIGASDDPARISGATAVSSGIDAKEVVTRSRT